MMLLTVRDEGRFPSTWSFKTDQKIEDFLVKSVLEWFLK